MFGKPRQVLVVIDLDYLLSCDFCSLTSSVFTSPPSKQILLGFFDLCQNGEILCCSVKFSLKDLPGNSSSKILSISRFSECRRVCRRLRFCRIKSQQNRPYLTFLLNNDSQASSLVSFTINPGQLWAFPRPFNSIKIDFSNVDDFQLFCLLLAAAVGSAQQKNS